MGIDPDAAEERAKRAGARICARGTGFSTWMADVMLEDPEGMFGRWGADWWGVEKNRSNTLSCTCSYVEVLRASSWMREG